MFYRRLLKLLVCLTLSLLLTLTGLVPALGEIYPAYAVDVLKTARGNVTAFVSPNESTDWYQIDKELIDAVRRSHDSTEEFAAYELDDWLNKLMVKVDDKFLSWYFSYFNQKAMEFGVPFAWLAFNADFLNLLKKEDETHINANQILQKRMINDLQNKFSELVLSPEDAQTSLSRLTERVARNYASALGMQLATIKNAYKIPDREWERYLNTLASLVYDTGASNYSLSPESITSNLATKSIIVATAGIGGKFALNFAAKAAAKIAAKAGGAIATKVTAQLIDPMLAVGILIWDTWDYNNMVNESRPVLRQNILEHLNEVKLSILDSPENSIMASIEDVERQIITALETSPTS
ncbi:MAG: hypothetical protein ICV63_05805 [Coleofasciculus sp. Co-bin14]|nr:hypothetical protein [Coleofasciculus sp. Co-bin14]